MDDSSLCIYGFDTLVYAAILLLTKSKRAISNGSKTGDSGAGFASGGHVP